MDPPEKPNMHGDKFKPKRYKQECERLYDDVMKQRLVTNTLQDENMKLKTRLQILYN